MMDVAARAH